MDFLIFDGTWQVSLNELNQKLIRWRKLCQLLDKQTAAPAPATSKGIYEINWQVVVPRKKGSLWLFANSAHLLLNTRGIMLLGYSLKC